MTEPTTFEALADELEQKIKGLGNLGVTMKFIFEGMGNVLIDARKELPTLTRNDETAADFTVIGQLDVWLALRAKKLAPHVAAMTRKIRFEGNFVTGLSLAPKIMTVL